MPVVIDVPEIGLDAVAIALPKQREPDVILKVTILRQELGVEIAIALVKFISWE